MYNTPTAPPKTPRDATVAPALNTANYSVNQSYAVKYYLSANETSREKKFAFFFFAILIKTELRMYTTQRHTLNLRDFIYIYTEWVQCHNLSTYTVCTTITCCTTHLSINRCSIYSEIRILFSSIHEQHTHVVSVGGARCGSHTAFAKTLRIVN